jgi:sugar lactone lactonase YvrE
MGAVHAIPEAVSTSANAPAVQVTGRRHQENMPMHSRAFAVAVTAASLVLGCSSPTPPAATEAPAPAMPPATITAVRGGFIPEGVEYDTTAHRFLTGSIAEGSVMTIGNDGSVTAVVTDPDLVASVGIEADEERDRLLVANSMSPFGTSGGPGQAKLGVYRLSTGERLAMVDLAATVSNPPADIMHFANDVAVGADGSAYVTDTRANIVYRVTPDYTASVLHRFDGFGPNGIVYHPSGYLLVVGGTMMYKVPVDNPDAATQVMLPEDIPGQDGAVWLPDGRLAIVSNSGNRVVTLTSADNWATAQLAGQASYATQATTAAVVGDEVYVVHPHFMDADPPSLERVTIK